MRSPFDLGAKQMKDISLRILDMECAACVARLDRALEKLPELKGCQAHSTVMLTEGDFKVFKKLGVELTNDPIYETK